MTHKKIILDKALFAILFMSGSSMITVTLFGAALVIFMLSDTFPTGKIYANCSSGIPKHYNSQAELIETLSSHCQVGGMNCWSVQRNAFLNFPWLYQVALTLCNSGSCSMNSENYWCAGANVSTEYVYRTCDKEPLSTLLQYVLIDVVPILTVLAILASLMRLRLQRYITDEDRVAWNEATQDRFFGIPIGPFTRDVIETFNVCGRRLTDCFSAMWRGGQRAPLDDNHNMVPGAQYGAMAEEGNAPQ
ncbi:MAG: hypothetical protein A3E84_04745 [Gammaproteobacteria bacterium RIFCSPHIGHO2_12_FULL_42_13]|nr:MAG: hypothetical protein A3E84_04745 [Gammaproteobacteria bacterium RIFCSPHIGHO2_12_FULL_42_13]